MDKNKGTAGGIGILTVLTLIFVVLKLVGVINWSWWLVLLPTFINIGFTIIVLTIYVVYVIHECKKYGVNSKKGKKDKWRF